MTNHRKCYWCRMQYKKMEMVCIQTKQGPKWRCGDCPKRDPKIRSTPVGGMLGQYRILARRKVA